MLIKHTSLIPCTQTQTNTNEHPQGCADPTKTKQSTARTHITKTKQSKIRTQIHESSQVNDRRSSPIHKDI